MKIENYNYYVIKMEAQSELIRCVSNLKTPPNYCVTTLSIGSIEYIFKDNTDLILNAIQVFLKFSPVLKKLVSYFITRVTNKQTWAADIDTLFYLFESMPPPTFKLFISKVYVYCDGPYLFPLINMRKFRGQNAFGIYTRYVSATAQYLSELTKMNPISLLLVNQEYIIPFVTIYIRQCVYSGDFIGEKEDNILFDIYSIEKYLSDNYGFYELVDLVVLVLTRTNYKTIKKINERYVNIKLIHDFIIPPDEC